MIPRQMSFSWPRVADDLLRSAAWLAPADARRDWLREWRAELAWRLSRSTGTAGPAVVLRCLGAFVHAAWLRWDRWRPEMLIQDLRYAIRGLRHRPGFAAVTILTLALGIGANAAIFAAVNAVLLRPLPFAEPDRLVEVFKARLANPDRACCNASPPDFTDWRRDNTVFTGLAALNDGSYPLAGDGPAEQIPGASVTGDFFAVLGVNPIIGRALAPADDPMGGPQAVVLGAGLWRRRFGGEQSVIGRRILLDGISREVVGVMPDGFSFPLGSEIWVPLRFSADDLATQRGAHYLDVIGRLRPGVTLDDARVAMRAMGGTLATTYPRTNRNHSISVHPLRDALVGDARLSLMVLLGAVGFVLLIVCVNVAGLLLTRSLARGRELAIRAAVGAGRAALVRGLLVESLVLALAGGGLGVVLAWWGSSIIAAVEGGATIPLLDQTRVDLRVLLFAFATALVTVLLFGVAPAWRASRVGDVAQRIRTEGTNTTGDVSSQRWRGTLIVVQTALAVMLLIGAGLLVRSFSRLLAVDRGFDLANIQTFAISLPETAYTTPEQRAAFVDDLVARVARQPGVEHAAAVFGLPFQDFNYGISTSTIDGRRLSDDDQDDRTLQVRIVTPDYFRAVGMTIGRGRGFTAIDRLGAEPVAIVSDAAVKLLWPDQDPLGRHFTLGTRMGQGGVAAGGTVVGIARDVHDRQPGLPPRPTIYLAHAQFPVDFVSIVARARSDPARLVEPMRRLLAELDSNIPMFDVRTMEQLGADVVSKPRLYTVLLGAFAIVAVFLSALGLYGMLAHLVSQRTPEIAIRVALGADHGAVIGMVVGRAAWLAACGVVAGSLVAVMASRLLRGMLFAVSATDATTYAVVAISALAIALVASWLPARRATRIQPVIALRLD